MGDEERSGSYGFAPRDGSARSQADRRPSARPGTAQSSAAPRRPASAPRRGHRDRARHPAWMWLLIGLLVGAGTTLLAASLWLGDRSATRMASGPLPADASEAADPDGQAPVGISDRDGQTPLATAATNGDITKEGAPERAIERAVESDGAQIEAIADRPGGEAPPIPSPPAIRPEATLPPDGAAQAERLATADELATTPEPASRVAASEALAALAAETAPPPSPDQPRAPRLRPTEAGTDLAAEAEPPLDDAGDTPAPSPPRARTDIPPPPQPGASRPSAENERIDLPLRVRQALQAANALERTASLETDQPERDRIFRVQLAAVDDETAAQVYWQEANQRLPGVFADVEPIFDQSQVDERTYFRVWVGTFDSGADARSYCEWLQAQGQDCFVTQIDNP